MSGGVGGVTGETTRCPYPDCKIVIPAKAGNQGGLLLNQPLILIY